MTFAGIVDGCGKQYHVSCLRNADLVKADEEIIRDSFVVRYLAMHYQLLYSL